MICVPLSRMAKIALGLVWIVCALSFKDACAASLKICEDTEDFAPFMFHGTSKDPAQNKQLQGVTVEITKWLEQKLNVPVQFDLIPWNRCMAMVERGDYDLGADAYFDAERARQFDFSKAYYVLTPQLFFNKLRWPDGFPATSVSQLKKWNGCGVLGYSYEHYGFIHNELDLGAKDHEQLIGKLKLGRCDYFLEELEVVMGFNRLGKDYLSDAMLGHQAIKDAKSPRLHFMISKAHKNDNDLLGRLNKAIDELIREGKIAGAMTKYTTAE